MDRRKGKKKTITHLSALDAWRRCCLPCLPGAVLMDARVGPASVVVLIDWLIVELEGEGQ